MLEELSRQKSPTKITLQLFPEAEQSLTINHTISTMFATRISKAIAADYLFQLIDRTLTRYATYIDLNNGIARSRYTIARS